MSSPTKTNTRNVNKVWALLQKQTNTRNVNKVWALLQKQTKKRK